MSQELPELQGQIVEFLQGLPRRMLTGEDAPAEVLAPALSTNEEAITRALDSLQAAKIVWQQRGSIGLMGLHARAGDPRWEGGLNSTNLADIIGMAHDALRIAAHASKGRISGREGRVALVAALPQLSMTQLRNVITMLGYLNLYFVEEGDLSRRRYVVDMADRQITPELLEAVHRTVLIRDPPRNTSDRPGASQAALIKRLTKENTRLRAELDRERSLTSALQAHIRRLTAESNPSQVAASVEEPRQKGTERAIGQSAAPRSHSDLLAGLPDPGEETDVVQDLLAGLVERLRATSSSRQPPDKGQ